jgi:hypothetical protein
MLATAAHPKFSQPRKNSWGSMAQNCRFQVFENIKPPMSVFDSLQTFEMRVFHTPRQTSNLSLLYVDSVLSGSF